MRSIILWSLLIGLPATALAQDSVLLDEVMPELAGSELGDVAVAAAPAPGAVTVVRARDVRRALLDAGLTADGLKIPASTQISRKLVRIPTDTLIDAGRAALEAATDPCSLQRVNAPKEVTLTEGPRQIRVEVSTPLHSGRMSGAVVVESGHRSVRVPLTLNLSCPDPEITTGEQITLVVAIGNVRVSSPGEARQAGRKGEVIRVQSRATGTALRGRVLNDNTVEVIQ
jgi:hypothetical protein